MSTKRGRKNRRGGVVRRDPPELPPDIEEQWGKLKDADPTKHYVAADPADKFRGVVFYRHRGYTECKRVEGGVRFVIDEVGENSDLIEQYGMRLMEIDLGDPDDPKPGTKAFLDAPGQRRADLLEARIVNKQAGGIDALRGKARQAGRPGDFDLVNETSPSFIERGA